MKLIVISLEGDQMNTKEKILNAALDLFSVRGYEDTSVVEIAEAVGIKAPSLYKHFGSKQAIFSAILQKIDEQYNQQASALQLEGNLPEADAVRYREISEEALFSMVLQMFRFFLLDPYVAKCRKILILEQYKNAEAADLYRKQYFEGPLAYHRGLFHQLIQSGMFKNEDPETLALQFYSPIFLLLQLCDAAPQQITKAEEMLKKHIFAFHKAHKQEAEK